MRDYSKLKQISIQAHCLWSNYYYFELLIITGILPLCEYVWF